MVKDEIRNAESSNILARVSEFQKTAPINLRWAIQRHYTSLVEYGVIVRYGRKILISPSKFWDWLSIQSKGDYVEKK